MNSQGMIRLGTSRWGVSSWGMVRWEMSSQGIGRWGLNIQGIDRWVMIRHGIDSCELVRWGIDTMGMKDNLEIQKLFGKHDHRTDDSPTYSLLQIFNRLVCVIRSAVIGIAFDYWWWAGYLEVLSYVLCPL